MAKNKTQVNLNEKPAWMNAQQKETVSKDSSEHFSQKESSGMVKVKMLTDYRDVVKAGEIWTTDAAKAKELVELGRAEYVK